MSKPSQFSLLKQRRFGPFFVAQFLGAFDDNVFRNALVLLVAFHATSPTTLAPAVLVNLAIGAVVPLHDASPDLLRERVLALRAGKP